MVMSAEARVSQDGVEPPAIDSVDEPVVRLRHPWRWTAAALILAILVRVLWWMATNPAFRWDLVLGYLFEDTILWGVLTTLKLTVLAMLLGVTVGTGLAIMRLSDNPVLRGVSSGFIWFFRGTPVLVQMVLWYYLGAVLPEISLGLPFMEPFWTVSSNAVITPLMAATFGLGLNEAAYMAEIVRAGIQGVDRGQREAAEALGMSPVLQYRRVILPQAARLIIPPTGNEVITMLKLTSLVTVIGLVDLLVRTQQIAMHNLQVFPMLLVATIWYLALTSILTLLQGRLERRFGRGVSPRLTKRRPVAQTGGR